MTILFLCTGNSCRSQMAEAWARALWPAPYQALSAGTHPQGMNPITATVMAEVGISLAGHLSKAIDDLDITQIDVLATVCDSAHEACPHVPGIPTAIHHSFPDPYAAGQDPTDEDVLQIYRTVRDEIRVWVEQLPQSLLPAERS